MDIYDQILNRANDLPEFQQWPELGKLLLKAKCADWAIPVTVAESFGVSVSSAIPVAAAIACLQVSIILIDDILDNDPRGAYHEYGVGKTANFALALQACGQRLIADAGLSPEQQSRAQNIYAQTAAQTAFGQEIDTENLKGEDNYWRVTHAKSTPFFTGAFRLGAICADASSEIFEKFLEFGLLFGTICQISDDLGDALDPELNADWQEDRNNLLFMYTEAIEHADQTEFQDLKARITEDGALKRGQEILVRSGAVSYALYSGIEKIRQAEVLLKSMNLPNPTPLRRHLDMGTYDFEHLLHVALPTETG